jgi:hypothetical protein
MKLEGAIKRESIEARLTAAGSRLLAAVGGAVMLAADGSVLIYS